MSDLLSKEVNFFKAGETNVFCEKIRTYELNSRSTFDFRSLKESTQVQLKQLWRLHRMLHDSGGGHRSDDLLTMRLSTTEKLQFLQSLAYQSTEKDTVQAMITNLNRGIKVDMFD